jgi:uncharacterized membrane protein YfcA
VEEVRPGGDPGMNEILIEILAGGLVGLCLGLLGAGGSILLVPIIDYLLGDSAKAAIVQALAVVCIIAAFAGGNAARRKLVDWRAVLLVGPIGMLGSLIGSQFSKAIPEAIQMTAFGLVMALAAWKILRSKPTAEGDRPVNIAKALVAGFAVGCLTGLIGVGGGFLIVPMLTLVLGVPIRLAIGTSLVLIAVQSGVALAGHWFVLDPAIEAEIQPHTVLILGGFGVAGSLFGASLGKRLDQVTLRKTFGWFLVVVATIVIVDYASGLVTTRDDLSVPNTTS